MYYFSILNRFLCQVTDDPLYISLSATKSHNHLFYFYLSNGLPISPADKMRKPTLVTLLAGAPQHVSIFKKRKKKGAVNTLFISHRVKHMGNTAMLYTTHSTDVSQLQRTGKKSKINS